MNFYLLDDPAKPGEFARFSHVGRWSEGAICKSCGELVGGQLIEPLQIEWNKGTERIGSFCWCGYTCVVTDDVRKRHVSRQAAADPLACHEPRLLLPLRSCRGQKSGAYRIIDN